jgi:hypothetical protein
LETGFAPSKRLAWRFTYYHAVAFHPFAGKPTIFGTGETRGDNFQTRLDFIINSKLRGHVDFETLLPGDFYSGNGRAYFLRFELIAELKAVVRNFSLGLLHQPAQVN